MQYVYTKIVIDLASSEILEKEGFWYEGPVDMACGASQQEKDIFQMQKSAYATLQDQASQIFGASSKIFSDLTSAFEPILAAGPGQEGYTVPQKAALESRAITQTGEAYRHAQQAAGERIAASGGGQAVLPAGSTAALQARIAAEGAGATAEQLSNIDLQSAERGRQNWLSAAGVLSGAPSVFNPATGAAEAGTQAGGAAAGTAKSITQANQSWMQPVAGILGGIAGAATAGLTGGMSAAAPAATGGSGKCYVAARIFGGWNDPRTILVRNYLFTQFNRSWYGSILTKLYEKYGEWVSNHKIFVKALTPLFNLALVKARKTVRG